MKLELHVSWNPALRFGIDGKRISIKTLLFSVNSPSQSYDALIENTNTSRFIKITGDAAGSLTCRGIEIERRDRSQRLIGYCSKNDCTFEKAGVMPVHGDQNARNPLREVTYRATVKRDFTLPVAKHTCSICLGFFGTWERTAYKCQSCDEIQCAICAGYRINAPYWIEAELNPDWVHKIVHITNDQLRWLLSRNLSIAEQLFNFFGVNVSINLTESRVVLQGPELNTQMMSEQIDRLTQVQASYEFMWTLVQTAHDVKLEAQNRALGLMLPDVDQNRAARNQITLIPDDRPDLDLQKIENFAEGTSLTERATIAQRKEIRRKQDLEFDDPDELDTGYKFAFNDYVRYRTIDVAKELPWLQENE